MEPQSPPESPKNEVLPYTNEEWLACVQGQATWEVERLVASLLAARKDAHISRMFLSVLCMRQGGAIAFAHQQLAAIPKNAELQLRDIPGGLQVRLAVPKPAIVIANGRV